MKFGKNQIVELLHNLRPWKKHNPIMFTELFMRFHQILQENNALMKLITDMEDKLGGEFVFDQKYLQDSVTHIEEILQRILYNFNYITNNKYTELYPVIEDLSRRLKSELAGQIVTPQGITVLTLDKITEIMADSAGNKAYNLSRILNLPQTNVPFGFVVTIGGFRRYLAYNNLFDQIEGLFEQCRSRNRSLESISNQIRLLILGGDIPPELRRDILRAAEQISQDQLERCLFSVRSSAVGEDGDLSFAGLHESFLNIPFRELLSSYKKALAGLYSPGSLQYRITRQLPFTELAMAVLYQPMVSSRVAGVAYTLDPNNPQEETCLVSAGWGLGNIVVEGRNPVDTLRISRHRPYQILSQRTGEKSQMMVSSLTDAEMEVPEELRKEPCLQASESSLIVETALILERYFKYPLDIEWSLDEDGKLWILQARPLGLTRGCGSLSCELKDVLVQHTVLLERKGQVAYRGVGAGPVWIAEDSQSLNQFPSGSVLVARFAMPWLAKALPRASAVITDVGSPTSHMATVAREFRVPTIVDTGVATGMLVQGDEVTVDAERNVVYAGRINELLHYQLLERTSFETSYEFQLLRRILKYIAPLNLIDPESPGFSPQGCQTFHDIMRFIHEKSVQTLIKVAKDPHTLLKRGGRRLRTKIPLNLILIDIGGGLSDDLGKSEWVEPEQITSRPMKAFWEGMASPESWNTDPVSVDFKGLMSSLTRTQAAAISGHALTGLNLAVVGSDYMNVSLRVGYHFTVIDARIGPQESNNKIFFRFIGGATSLVRRSRRAKLLHTILEKVGFKIQGQGDIVLARAINVPCNQMDNYLTLVGRLTCFARQLDILLTDDATIDVYLEKFLKTNMLDLSDSAFQEEA